jgi:hypothetical protein
MRVALLAAVLALAGCATTESVWMKSGATQQDFYMDRGQCQAQAFGVSNAPLMQVAIVFNACMQGKGWYTQERPTASAAQIRSTSTGSSPTNQTSNACMHGAGPCQ